MSLPDSPGLGIEIDPAAIRRYLVSVVIEVNKTILFDSGKQNI